MRQFSCSLLLLILSFAIFSCKKSSEEAPSNQVVKSGFTYSSNFYKLPRKVLYREDFNSPGSWEIDANIGSAEWCHNNTDTSIGTIANNLLTLIPKSLNHQGNGYMGVLFAKDTLPSIPMKKDQAYGVEIHFKEYFKTRPAGASDPSSSFKLTLNEHIIQPLDEEEGTINLDNSSLHFCIRNDSLLGFVDSPNEVMLDFRDRKYLTISPTADTTNSIVFSGNFVSIGGSGCEGQNTIVDYFEIYEIQ